MKADLVSIVIPVYNAEKYLKQCLNSIVNQLHENIEIICVDDGSTDGSLEILRDYSSKDSRFIVIEQNNRFAGIARNVGMSRAKGEYVCFIDADDYLEKKYIDELLASIQKSDADIAICRYSQYDEERKELREAPYFISEKYFSIPNEFNPLEFKDWIFFLSGGWAWDKLFKTEFIRREGLVFQDTRIANDGYFVNLSMVYAQKISFVNKKLIIHRINNEASIEGSRYKYWDCGIKMLCGVFDGLSGRGLFENYGRSFRMLAGSYLIWFLRTMNDEDEFVKLYFTVKNGIMEEIDLIHDYGGEYLCEEEKNIQNELLTIKNDSPTGYILKCLIELNHEVSWRDYDIVNYKRYIQNRESIIKAKRWWINEEDYKQSSKIIVYGYGDVGKDIVWQIKHSARLKLAGIIDKSHTECEGVISLDDINDYMFDYILIAIKNKEVADEVKNDIKEKGVNGDRIKWIF